MYYSQKIKMVLLKGMLFLCSPFYRMRHPVPEEKRKRVIVIRNDALGDFIVFLYSAFALRKALPRSEYCITLFVTSNNVKWAEKSDLFDEVFSIRRVACKQSFPQVMDQFLLFHSLRADVLVNALHGRDGDSDLPAFASRAKRKYAFSLSEWQHPDCEKIKFYERVYTETLPLPMEKSLIDSTCSLFQMALQCPIVPSPLPAAQVGFLKDLSYPVDNLPHPYCVLVPGSNSKRRNWSAENFIETVQMLKKNFPDLHFIVTGGPSENDLCRKIALSVQAVDLCGKLDLSELASV